MPTPLTTPQFYAHYQATEMCLAAAQKEEDPERQRTLALLASAYATLCQVDATWLVDRRQR